MRKKILIVEDDQTFANVYRNKLVHEGFEAEATYDGEKGLALLRSYEPDAVLLDLMLPKVSGLDFIKQIRSEARFANVPIIVFTNTYLTSMVQDAWKAGATKCLTKASCTPSQVISALRNALNGVAAKAAAAATAAPEPEPIEIPTDPDVDFQLSLRKSFIESLPAATNTIRTLLQGMIKAEHEAIRLKQIAELHRRMNALTGNAAVAGMSRIAQMADALSALLKELHEKPKNINTSTIRTVTSAIDFLAVLFDHANDPEKEGPAPKILVVDDEAISLRAVSYALEKAKLKSLNVDDTVHALELLAARPFDLVLLDIGMPSMSGFELCSKLRGLPAHKTTPVIFVTSLNDLENRANSMMSGGNDFIAKPFLFIELTVKALIYVLRGQLSRK